MSLETIIHSVPWQKMIVTDQTSARLKAQLDCGLNFILALGSTALGDMDELSAAGNSKTARRSTAMLDAVALSRGASTHTLPVSPSGVTSPVVITSACLDLLRHDLQIFDCGLFVKLPTDLPHTQIADSTADLPEHGAMPLSLVHTLYQAGLKHGSAHSKNKNGLLCLAECVPGGTSTAALVLTLLSIDAMPLVSASLPGAALTGKRQILEHQIQKVCAREGVSLEDLKISCVNNPHLAVSLAGDTMQPFAAGFLSGALDSGTELAIAAGGSQMIALVYLASKLAQASGDTALSNRLLAGVTVVTTTYVAADKYAGVQKLADLTGVNLLAVDLMLQASRHAGLKAYTDGHVKEGVGAGAACALALMQNTRERVLSAIDERYEIMTGVKD